MMSLKQSCKSQFLAVWKEASEYIEQGYTKKAIYNFFCEQKKIDMSYVAWTKLINNANEPHPFAQAQIPASKKRSTPDSSPIKSKTIAVNQKGFQHNSRPYVSQSDLKPQKKNDLPVNLISKGDL